MPFYDLLLPTAQFSILPLRFLYSPKVHFCWLRLGFSCPAEYRSCTK